MKSLVQPYPSTPIESSHAVDLTLLVCTYNRSADLREMLQTALTQETEDAFTYDVLVVDNNSSDATRAVVDSFQQCGHRNLRYLFEGRQGRSYALNTGLGAITGWGYAIVDDDFILPPTWVKTIMRGFRDHPNVAYVSGKVLPQWQALVPEWLTPAHWSALAISDYGDEVFYTHSGHQLCLLACAFRHYAVERVGGYRSELGVSSTLIGGVEDLDIQQRLWNAGYRGVYLPNLQFRHKVPADRISKAYHRRWHAGHGRFYAALHDADFERSRVALLGVPGHLYRQAASDLLKWIKCLLIGPSVDRFTLETKLRFFAGFWMERRSPTLTNKAARFKNSTETKPDSPNRTENVG